MSVLTEVDIEGEKLSELELELFFLLLTVAGNETTRNLISGGMVAFFENPDQWQLPTRRPLATAHRGRGDAPLREPGHGLPPADHRPHRARGPGHRGGLEGRLLPRLGEP